MLPSWVYQAGDDFLYSMYQRMVLFFFEHCTALKVCSDMVICCRIFVNICFRLRFTSVVMLIKCLQQRKMFSTSATTNQLVRRI